ncbi:MAG: hypothetical protein ACOCT9_02785 [archaeon]
MKNVVADSTFYILFYGDIKDDRSLYHILDKYEMFVGEKLEDELEKHIKGDRTFEELTNNIDEEVDFGHLLQTFYDFLLSEYPELNQRIKDAEYEAIGMSYLLKQYDNLNYLIIDDKYPYNFVDQNLPFIQSELNRTIGFLYSSCKEEGILEERFVLNILDEIEKAIERGENPLYLTRNIWNEKIKPLKTKLDGDD